MIKGDLRHFGVYFGDKALGVLVLRPADYLKGGRLLAKEIVRRVRG